MEHPLVNSQAPMGPIKAKIPRPPRTPRPQRPSASPMDQLTSSLQQTRKLAVRKGRVQAPKAH